MIVGKIVLYLAMSVDGYIADEQGGGDGEKPLQRRGDHLGDEKQDPANAYDNKPGPEQGNIPVRLTPV